MMLRQSLRSRSNTGLWARMAWPAATLTPSTAACSRLSTTQKSMTPPSPAWQVGSSGAQISPPIRSSQP
eukprot:6751339-Lingulodinium_polyedra.AAC.1